VIAHVVLFRPRADVTAEERQLLLRAFERAVREIDSVRRVRIGQRVRWGAGYEGKTPEDAEYLVVIDFDDLDGLRAYLGHPAHEELGTRFNQALHSALIYDFDLGSLDGRP
jgi:hypothetical protein